MSSHAPSGPLRERDEIVVRRALLSVYDKTGLLELAAALSAAGVELVSTGSTAQKIADAGYPVTEVSQLTGFPESLDGRVKTLHPAVHAGLLADLRLFDHEVQLSELGIKPFELVVSNLYPFAETVASGAEPDAVVEQIDIGGPTMVRASAKNHANVAIVTSPEQYADIIDAVQSGGTTLAQRRNLALAAFRHTATYDIAVASWLGSVVAPDDEGSGFPGWVGGSWERENILRYGENSHQRAALYGSPAGGGIAQATLLGGKEMSYNNYMDADAALRAAYDHEGPTLAIIKHANPCGIATADTIAAAHIAANACDPVSAFGGVIAANRPITAEAAASIAPIFTEVIVAPGFEPEALEILREKPNLRLLQLPADYNRGGIELRQISGGVLLQTIDNYFESAVQWKLVAGPAADAAQLADLEFAWRACRSVKSNGILLASGGASVGVGMGQVNRVDSCKLAVDRAGDRAAGSVAASDAFFPFADGPQILIDAGVRAIVQPGGSVRDDEVVAAANAAGVTMYFTGERHFFH
ncbi:MAG TPA: bifunctional phosphoribosylaminoimidazolecarboxamide formyltransferase/IMP cyclohydrolase [Pseudolysinimonas sp.]|nr:bifunctional phosphoribosylaminoimidazolecarboxamide formyltransferase/IMP cyclohydrolase [Pseudolysinimonas sp.]